MLWHYPFYGIESTILAIADAVFCLNVTKFTLQY